jgi:ABC-type sugar transport system substrate-binding protein
MTRRLRDMSGALPRRALMRGVGAGSIAAYLGAAAGPAGAAEGGPFPPHPRWKFVFVNHVTSNPFFVPCQYGIQDACALLSVDYQWTGSETSDVAQMVNAFNTAIAGKADAIAVCLVDPRASIARSRMRSPRASRCSATMPIRTATSASPISARICSSPAR